MPWDVAHAALRAMVVVLQKDGVSSATLKCLLATKPRILAYRHRAVELSSHFPGRREALRAAFSSLLFVLPLPVQLQVNSCSVAK